MEYNVSYLLKGLVGERREYPIDGTVPRVDETPNPSPVDGHVEMVRTNDGILARAKAVLKSHEECSRCLDEFDAPLEISFEEEYFPSININTGAPMPPPREPDAFMIDHNHVINLESAIREYALVERQMQPLCRDDCAGLCPTCGVNRNESKCDCDGHNIDPRWLGLAQFSGRE